MTTAQPLTKEPITLEALVKRSAYTERFREVLGQKAPAFMSSLIAVGREMPDVEPKSILGSAMQAAVLDLPIDRSLGFAWIVPYREGERKYAQFQIGYKGFVQLAQRSGCYYRMNATPVNKEAVKGYDEVGEPIIDWGAINPEAPACGYVFSFKLTNGFSKVCYWSRAKVEAHAKRYSQSYRKGKGPWKEEFDKMALKTVIKNELSDWGILSIQFRRGLESDQAVIKTPDAVPEFPDNALLPLGEEGPTQEPADRIPLESPPSSGRDDAAQTAAPISPSPESPPPATPPAQSEPEEAPQQALQRFVIRECGQTFDVFQKWGRETGMVPQADSLASFDDIPTKLAERLLRAKTGLAQGLTKTVLNG